MVYFDKLKKYSKLLTFIEITLFLIISIIHFVFYFLIKETDFGNIFDAFDSSPLFDFYIDNSCGANSHITFHVWEGREVHYYGTRRTRKKTEIVDRTDIDKINGNYFCYRHVS